MPKLLIDLYAYIQTYDWDNPMTFGLVVLAMLALFGKWRIIFISFATCVLARLGHDLIVMNISTMHEIITVTNVIYVAGGALILMMLALAFIKYMLST